jgi:regulator of protease activity HflC (stomatin/prohibitin superfamily)
MTGLAPEADTALEPVRTALRAAAEKQAARLRDDAGRQAGALLDAAWAEAARILADAATEGEAAARSEAALRSARARREAHELVLARRSALRLELHRRVREAAAGLKSDPRYAELMTRLTEQCAELLGAGASVSESPDGGVVAEAASRRLDLSLPVLAEMTLDSMPEVRELWTR